MIDFSLSPQLAALKGRTEDFIREVVIAYEGDPREGAHGPSDELRRELMAKAREAGLLSPQVGEEWGGLGLDMRGAAVVFEAAGYSLLGPQALNCAAPDEGNMHLLEVVGTQAQKERWLRPLAAGEIRSCFSMTEPGGAGSDPNMLATTARQDGNHWVISGHKWFITGFDGAKLNIVMARTSERIERGKGATMFLVDNDDPNIERVRVQDTMESSLAGGHCEIRFHDLRVTPDQVLGEIGEGYRYAQVRLAPARLTHCMRWLGAARRAHDIACAYAVQREAFGKILGEHEGVGFMLADNEMDMHISRLAVWQAAWLLDQGEQARQETSMAKVICAEAAFRVADRCVQILGGTGVTSDTLVERLWREIRPFRIYDGPSEVHRWAIAKRIVRRTRKALAEGLHSPRPVS
jgi:acyl-CoA dehydrogenase